MKIRKYMILVTLLVVFSLFFEVYAQDVERGTNIAANCGDIIESEFTKNFQDNFYSIDLKPGDQLQLVASPLGDNLAFRLDLFGPSGILLSVSNGNKNVPYREADNESNPKLDSGVLPGSGTYSIIASNYDLNGSLSSYTGGIGVYTLYIGCKLRGGTVINPGDKPPAGSNNSVPATPAFSGNGFPGLAPVDFANAFTNDLTLGQPIKSKIPPSGDAVLGYTFDAKANDNLSLSFTRTTGNLNLGLVVLSADNKVVFQASLVTSSELTTKFTLPSDGTYTIGIFRIDLLPPASPEATAFQLTATLNP